MGQELLVEEEAVIFYDLQPKSRDVLPQVLAGLRQTPKSISPKFFYNQRGSQLFEQITRLPEYYLTRTERSIFRQYGHDMAERIGPGRVLLELGSGSSSKIRLLMKALRPHAYVSADISKTFLLESSRNLKEAYPELDVRAICLDYTSPWRMPVSFGGRRILAFFPGSTIGNFQPTQALAFLKNVREVVGPRGALLIGVDLIKDHQILHRAYNDAAGVTAAFNLNVLSHLNRRVGADFDLDSFEHVAFFNADEGRVEMHLEAQADQRVTISGQSFDITQGERILTEYSYKYSFDRFQSLIEEAGFQQDTCWTDDQEHFGVFLLT